MADKNYGITTALADVEHDNSSHGQSTRGDGTRGYGVAAEKPVFDRYISLVGIMNFGFCIQGAWAAIGLLMSLMFLNGGPASAVWGCMIAGIGHVATAASLGEMASMDPTVGAQYRWSARFARTNSEFWGLIQGWLTTFAWVVGCIGAPQIIATLIQALISFHNPVYVPKAWHTTLLMWAILAVALIFNLALRRILNVLETLGGIFNVLFFVAIVIILCTLGERSSASYVFTTLTSNVSGWTNQGVAFQLGLGLVYLPLSGYDSVLHMIDETKKPRERVPKTMIIATAMNTVISLAYIITLLFFVGDLETVSMSPMPIIEIYFQATKSKTATTIMVLMHGFINLVSGFNILASASRLTWAFARDKGLPFHEIFSRVNPRLQIPLQALAFSCAVPFVLALINLGSSVALSAIISLQAIAILASYIPPIVLLLIRKLTGEHPQYGPFILGRWGIPINLFSLVFLIWGCFWTCFPISYPVTTETMNWAAPVWGGVVCLALLDWFTSGKRRFEVPVGDYNIEMSDRKISEAGSSK